MYIQRSNYWPGIDLFPREFSRALSRLFDADGTDRTDVATSEWAPRVDVREDDKRFVISADIPGVDPKEIEIHMDQGMLSIRGERKSEGKTGNGKYTRIERSHGSFHRRFALPDSADPEHITATGEHGVLEIVIPRRPESTPRRIDIQTAA